MNIFSFGVVDFNPLLLLRVRKKKEAFWSSRCQSKCTVCHLTVVDSVFVAYVAVPTVADDRRDKGQRLDCCTVWDHTLYSHSQRLANQKRWDTGSEMVNKIISHAQHILWAQAVLLCLPPVALFTKKRALCISSKYRKDHFCQEPKRMKRNRQKSFFFFGGAEGYENHLVFYFWSDFHIHGHLREVRLLWPTSSQGKRLTVKGTQTHEQTIFHPFQQPRHSLSSLAPPRLSHG